MSSSSGKRAVVMAAAALSACLMTTAASSATPAETVKVVTLGTGGGPVVRLKRAQTSNAVVVGESVYLIDAGEGLLRQLRAAGIRLGAVRAIFITHHHLDHTADLTAFLGLRWMNTVTPPLKLRGPAGLHALAEGFRTSIQPAVDVDFARSPHPLSSVDVREIEAPGLIYEDDQIRVFAAENTHYHAPLADSGKTLKSYSYRIETAHGVVVFTGDTGPSGAVTQLARGADLLISEVIDLDGTIRALAHLAPHLSAERRASLAQHLAEDHLLPEQVGALAAAAGVKQVVLSHLAPGLDSETSTLPYSAGVKKNYDGPVIVAEDLMVFPLTGASPGAGPSPLSPQR